MIALFSGGYDSLCATHVTVQHPRFAGVLHMNTGIGIPQTRHFVRAICRAYGWPLLEYRSPIRYEDIVLTQGFPGPSAPTIVRFRQAQIMVADPDAFFQGVWEGQLASLDAQPAWQELQPGTGSLHLSSARYCDDLLDLSNHGLDFVTGYVMGQSEGLLCGRTNPPACPNEAAEGSDRKGVPFRFRGVS